ncbi:DUF1772 domain-containing protein [Frankia sp. QA3]|uniref:anthrone oxygenase family protein n=1 Tax=Frankia sp. QA3 TaxID=710111 RepID=UPI000269C744|nr:anthrone oxygenase family protein [Frankia sp. QA3]EIV94844.1 putative integral membrane protein [Frankia sp. QA3]
MDIATQASRRLPRSLPSHAYSAEPSAIQARAEHDPGQDPGQDPAASGASSHSAASGRDGHDGRAAGTRRTGRDRAALGLVALAVLALALIAGFFYAYACSVMVGLAEVDDRTFITTMQSINATVRNWGFAPSFFGATLITAVALAALGRRWRSPEWRLLAAALLVYTVGGLVLTMGISVPLNDELAAAGPAAAIADPAAIRADYEGPWVAWNLVRTVCSTLAFLLAAAALHRMGRTTRPRTARPRTDA